MGGIVETVGIRGLKNMLKKVIYDGIIYGNQYFGGKKWHSYITDTAL